MEGEERLAAVEISEEVADALLAPPEQVEDAEAPRIGERVEERRVPRQAVLGGRCREDHISTYLVQLMGATPTPAATHHPTAYRAGRQARFLATHSISTRAPSGSPATATVVRAGKGAANRAA